MRTFGTIVAEQRRGNLAYAFNLRIETRRQKVEVVVDSNVLRTFAFSVESQAR